MCCLYINLLFTLERTHSLNTDISVAGFTLAEMIEHLFFCQNNTFLNPNTQFNDTKYLRVSGKTLTLTLCKKCPYSEFFLSVFSRIRTEYGEIRSTLTTGSGKDQEELIYNILIPMSSEPQLGTHHKDTDTLISK